MNKKAVMLCALNFCFGMHHVCSGMDDRFSLENRIGLERFKNDPANVIVRFANLPEDVCQNIVKRVLSTRPDIKRFFRERCDLRKWSLPYYNVSALSMHNDLGAAGTFNGEIFIFNLENGQVLEHIQNRQSFLKSIVNPISTINGVAFRGNEFFYDQFGVLYRCQLENGKIVSKKPILRSGCSYEVKGNFIVFKVVNTCRVPVFDLQNNQLFTFHLPVDVIFVSVHGHYTAVADKYRRIHIVDNNNGALIRTIEIYKPIMAVAMSDDIVIAGHPDRSLTVWNIYDGQLKATLENAFSRFIGNNNHCEGLLCVDGNHIASCCNNGNAIKLWDGVTGRCCTLCNKSTRTINRFILDGKRLLVNAHDQIMLLDLNKFAEIDRHLENLRIEQIMLLVVIFDELASSRIFDFRKFPNLRFIFETLPDSIKTILKESGKICFDRKRKIVSYFR